MKLCIFKKNIWQYFFAIEKNCFLKLSFDVCLFACVYTCLFIYECPVVCPINCFRHHSNTTNTFAEFSHVGIFIFGVVVIGKISRKLGECGCKLHPIIVLDYLEGGGGGKKLENEQKKNTSAFIAFFFFYFEDAQVEL